MVSTDDCVGTRGAGAAEWEDLYCVSHSPLPRAAQVSGSPSLLKHHEGSRDSPQKKGNGGLQGCLRTPEEMLPLSSASSLSFL